MDKDQIWVLNADKGFELETVIDNVGKLPFDALIDGDRYIVGFLRKKVLGYLIFQTSNTERLSSDLIKIRRLF